MGICKLCGRSIKDNTKHYGSSYILKCYSLLGMDYNKIKNKERTLENRVMLRCKKISLSKTEKELLLDRYLTYYLLKNVKLNYYNIYVKNIQKDISNIKNSVKDNKIFISLEEAYEVYKFYNKYKKVINKNVKDIVLSDAMQNIYWDAFNFCLNKYYNKKEYLSGITQKLQYVFWKSGVGMLKAAGCRISADLLNNAISERAENLKFTEGYIVDEIKSNKDFLNKIENLLKDNKENNIEINNFIRFEENSSFDLKASLHNMNLILKGNKIGKKWNLHIYLEDDYDFTDLKELHEYIDGGISGFILSTANNAAILSTSCNVLSTYKIIIEFDMEMGDSIEK